MLVDLSLNFCIEFNLSSLPNNHIIELTCSIIHDKTRDIADNPT